MALPALTIRQESRAIPGTGTRRRLPDWAVACVAGGAFASCWLRSFIFPLTPVVPWGDETLFLLDATKIVAGLVPYRDFVQIVTPGTDYFYALLIFVFGPRSWLPGLTMACLSAAIAVTMTLLARRILSGWTAAVPAVLFCGLVVPQAAYPTHHWFSTLAVLVGALLLEEDGRRPKRMVLAGVLCGTAGLFAQPRVVLAMAAFLVFLWWEDRPNVRRNALLLSASALLTMAAGCSYFAWRAGFARLWFSLVTFPLRYYPVESFNNWRVLITILHLHLDPLGLVMLVFLYATVPLVYLVFLLYRRKEVLPASADRALILLTLAGAALFASVASAPSWLRMAGASPPALVVLVALLALRKSAPVGLAGLTALSGLVLLTLPAARQLQPHRVFQTPAGPIATVEQRWDEEMEWSVRHLSPGKPFFGMRTIGYVFHMSHPAVLTFVVPSEYTRPAEVDAVVQALARNTPPAMILPASYLHHAPEQTADHLEPFRRFLGEHYKRTRIFASQDELWELRNR